MSNYLPQHLEGDEDKLKDIILSMANGLPADTSPATRRIDYLDYLKTRYVLAQASWFLAKVLVCVTYLSRRSSSLKTSVKHKR